MIPPWEGHRCPLPSGRLAWAPATQKPLGETALLAEEHSCCGQSELWGVNCVVGLGGGTVGLLWELPVVALIAFLLHLGLWQIQSWMRMWLARKQYLERLRYFRRNVSVSALIVMKLLGSGGGVFPGGGGVSNQMLPASPFAGISVPRLLLNVEAPF